MGVPVVLERSSLKLNHLERSRESISGSEKNKSNEEKLGMPGRISSCQKERIYTIEQER